MKKIKASIVIIFFSLFFIFSHAYAQDTLIKSDIERYLATLPRLQSLNEATPLDNDSPAPSDIQNQESSLTSQTPITDNLRRMRNHPSFDKFTTIVQEAGFEDPTEWALVGDQIMTAYSAYLITNPIDNDAPTLDKMKQDLKGLLKKVEGNQFITPENKELLLNKIKNSMAMLNDPNYIANENISTIRPYIGRLTSYLRNTNDPY